MLIGVYDKGGDLALVAPLQQIAKALDISQTGLKKILDGWEEAPSWLIIAKVPATTSYRHQTSGLDKAVKSMNGIRSAYGRYEERKKKEAVNA